MEDVPRGTMDEVSSHVCLVLPSTDGKAARKIVPPRLRIPYWKGLGADSEEKHEPVSDIDTVVVDSLKALDPKRPIREADIALRTGHVRFVPILLQKSAYTRCGTAGAFFEAIHCHPRDCAGDFTLGFTDACNATQRTKRRTVAAGRPTWQACGDSAQSLPT